MWLVHAVVILGVVGNEVWLGRVKLDVVLSAFVDHDSIEVGEREVLGNAGNCDGAV